MDMNNDAYNAYVRAKSKPSPLLKDCLWAFLVGGAICTAGQALRRLYTLWMTPRPACR